MLADLMAKKNMCVFGVLVESETGARDDFADRRHVRGKQQRPKYRALWNACIAQYRFRLMLPDSNELLATSQV